MITTVHRICLAVLCIVCLSGCIRPNMRYTETGSMSARATLKKGVLPLYHEVKIRRPTEDSAPRFCLRLPDGRIIRRAAMTCDGLRQAGFEEIRPHEFRGHGISFLFVGNTLVELRLLTIKESGIGIGHEDAKTFYTLPLTQTDLESIFGHPDRISDGVYW